MAWYALLYRLSSQLVHKVCNSQSLYFDFTTFNFLDKVLVMENINGPHRDPNKLELDPDYSTLGSLGICKEMREQYDNQVRLKTCPALSSMIHEADLDETQSQDQPRKNHNGYKYHNYGLEYHMLRVCPSSSENNQGTEGRTIGTGRKNTDTSNQAWKYCAPVDENAILMVNGLHYMYYKHCVCKCTKTKGFFNCTDASSKTDTSDGYRFSCAQDDDGTSANPSSASDVSTATSTVSGVTTPEGNVGVITREKYTSTPALKHSTNTPNADDPDELEFVGVFLVDCPEDDVAAWITSVSDPSAFEPTVGVILKPDEIWYDVDEESPSNNDDNCVPVGLLPPHHYNGT